MTEPEVPEHRADRPLCTVLIPTYNMARYLDAAVRSVLADPLERVEVIVVDDGSTDATPGVMRTFTATDSPDYDPRINYSKQKNRGKSAALNTVLPLASGDYVTVLDADDELPACSLHARVQAAEQADGTVDMVVGGFEVFDDGGILGERPAPDVESTGRLRTRYFTRFRTPFHLNACLLSRRLVQRVGTFDERLRRCQDVDYALRCLEHADEVVVVDRPVYRYRKNRRSRVDRLRIRWDTLRHRTTVYGKAFSGVLAPVAVGVGVAVDLAKMVYNLFADYEE